MTRHGSASLPDTALSFYLCFNQGILETLARSLWGFPRSWGSPFQRTSTFKLPSQSPHMLWPF